ncbi:hypothetical protein GQ457_06G039910 [Hibiscus cannabinus]
MNSFDLDNVKAEKVKAMRRFHRLRSIAKVFRLLEALSTLLFLAWTFERLPFAFKISGEFVLKLGGVIASPLFVFLACNVIIVTLIVKSGIFSAVCNADCKIYEEFIKNAEPRSKPESREEIVYQDKEIITEVKTCSRKCQEMEPVPVPELEWDSDIELDNRRLYKRSKSEREEEEKEVGRSETEKCGGIENTAEKLIPEDGLSNEEFQRAIEDFIAKQLKFRREESLYIVLQGQAQAQA